MPAIRHGTLTADTVASVDLGVDVGEVDVCNVDGAAAIYFRVDGTNPTVAGNDSYVIPAALGASARVPVTSDGNTVVKLISVGTPAYSITAEF